MILLPSIAVTHCTPAHFLILQNAVQSFNGIAYVDFINNSPKVIRLLEIVVSPVGILQPDHPSDLFDFVFLMVCYL